MAVVDLWFGRLNAAWPCVGGVSSREAGESSDVEIEIEAELEGPSRSLLPFPGLSRKLT